MKLHGGIYYPDGEKHLIEWLKVNGVEHNGRVHYQWKKQVAVYAACQNFRVAVDIGAHVGTWSMNMLEHFAHVHAFEPVAAHRECFEANVPATDKLTMHPVAVGDRADLVNIKTDPASSGDSRVDGAGSIPMITLDSLALSDVDLIKIDTEGFEMAVLRGAEETIARCKPVICVEQKRGHAQRYGFGEVDAVPYLQSLGYRVEREIGGDFIMVHG